MARSHQQPPAVAAVVVAVAAAVVVAVVVAVLMRMDWVEKVAVAEASAVVSAEASG